MVNVYMLTHRRIVEVDIQTGEKIYSTCLLGFFSTKTKCEEMIKHYLKQPGFIDYPNDFVIETVEANGGFENTPNQFDKTVFFLSHEWYDGSYDHVSYLGYYSTRELAEKALEQYKKDPEFIDRLDEFCIDAYEIDKGWWMESFFKWR